MKSLVLHGPKDIRYEGNWPESKPSEGCALVRVRYSGICGSDLPRTMTTGAYHHPLICGHEFTGVIEEPASDSSGFNGGDAVGVLPLIPCGKCSACKEQAYFHCESYNFLGSRTDGGFAEYCVVPEDNLFRLPQKMDERYGAFLEPLSVALHVVRRSEFRSGQSALVLGAGPIGLLIGMWLKAFEAAEVTITDLREESLEIAIKAGFQHVTNPQTKEFENCQDYDVCFEAAGSQAALLTALEKVKRKGTVTVVGRDTKDTLIPLHQFESLMRKEVGVKGCWGYDNVGEDELIYQMLEKNRFTLEPLITHQISLQDGPELIRQMFHKEIYFCKVLFEL